MRLGRKKQPTSPVTSAGKAAVVDPMPQFAHSWSQSVSDQSAKFWVMLRNLPLVKDWRILSDSLFLLISFGLGLFWFITIVVLGAIGGGLSIVGIGMKSHAGIASRMFEVLAQESINIQMITTSEIKTSVVIEDKYLELAVRALHKAFGLEEDPA